MFKPLIKKVRENSNNPSILPENNTEEPNENSNKDNKNSFTEENSPSIRVHRRSTSNVQQSLRNQSRISIESDNKAEIVQYLSEIFTSHVKEPTSIDNILKVITSWMDSKEKNLQEKDDTIQNLIQETVNLQNELALFRNQFLDLQNLKEKPSTDNSAKIPYLQKQVDTLRSDNENLKSTIKSLRIQLGDVEAERDDLLIKSTDLSNLQALDDIKKQLDRQKLENERNKTEIESLREALHERDLIIEQQNKRLYVDHETQAIQTDEDKSFVEILAEPDVDTISKLQAELDDKNRTIKNLQQRYNDLRKTLQREFHASIPRDLNQMASSFSSSKLNSSNALSPPNLPLIHYDSTGASQSDVDTARRTSNSRQIAPIRKTVTFTSAATATTMTTATSTNAAILPHTSVESNSTKPQKNGQRASIDGQVALNGTNFKYLKHVLLKFMTSSEDEAIHLIRAVSTLLNFSADEERLVRETLDYKMSWFGKMSRHKPLVSNLNF